MTKDRWDKVDIIAKMVIGVLVPVVITFFGYKINRSIQEKAQQQKDVELSQKYIEIAVGILNSDPSKKEKEPLRDWAIDVLKKYSPIEISPAAIKALKEQRLSVEVLVSGVSAHAQVGDIKVTTTQGKTTSTKGIEGAGMKAEPGQLTVTDK
jgi:hypothetical protein